MQQIYFIKPREKSLHKKRSFPLRISSVNVTKSAIFLRIWSHLLKKSSIENFIFLCSEFIGNRNLPNIFFNDNSNTVQYH